jgi:hypothetical protein
MFFRRPTYGLNVIRNWSTSTYQIESVAELESKKLSRARTSLVEELMYTLGVVVVDQTTEVSVVGTVAGENEVH